MSHGIVDILSSASIGVVGAGGSENVLSPNSSERLYNVLCTIYTTIILCLVFMLFSGSNISKPVGSSSELEDAVRYEMAKSEIAKSEMAKSEIPDANGKSHARSSARNMEELKSDIIPMDYQIAQSRKREYEHFQKMKYSTIEQRRRSASDRGNGNISLSKVGSHTWFSGRKLGRGWFE